MTQEIIRGRGKKPSSSRRKTLDLGTWGHFHVRPALPNVSMPSLSKGGGDKRLSRVCLHCKQAFKTNREEQVFCKPGCRTYNNRLKRQGLVRWLIEQGVPLFTALDTVEISGMAAIARNMEMMGFYWTGINWEKK